MFSFLLQKQTQAANIDLLLSPLFCCGCVGISQQVCSFIFLLAHYSFYFSTSPPLKLISNLVCDGFFPPSSFLHLCSYWIVQGEKKKNAAVTSSPTGHTWVRSPFPPSPSVHLSTRLSDLSLRSMHPSPIPDAEAHGEDGNNRLEQLYFPNGEVPWSFPFAFTQTGRRCLLPASVFFFCSDAGISVCMDAAIRFMKTTC